MRGQELLRVSVLGNLAVLRHDTRMQLPPSKKTRSLLAYLAVTARAHSRDRLCAMFWAIPDDPRAALRWSLTRLRPLVDEPDCQRIIADRETVGLDLGHVTVDISTVRGAARNGTDSMSTDALRQATAALEAAAAMAGEIELARASLQELRRAQPNISLAWVAEHMPLRKDKDEREHCLEAFRRAGLD